MVVNYECDKKKRNKGKCRKRLEGILLQVCVVLHMLKVKLLVREGDLLKFTGFSFFDFIAKKTMIQSPPHLHQAA